MFFQALYRILRVALPLRLMSRAFVNMICDKLRAELSDDPTVSKHLSSDPVILASKDIGDSLD